MTTSSNVRIGLLAGVVASAVVLAAAPAANAADTEKCYGVAKSGQNDCKTDAHSCAGQSKAEKDPASFIAVPAGTCAKIAGGSTTPKK